MKRFKNMKKRIVMESERKDVEEIREIIEEWVDEQFEKARRSWERHEKDYKDWLDEEPMPSEFDSEREYEKAHFDWEMKEPVFDPPPDLDWEKLDRKLPNEIWVDVDIKGYRDMGKLVYIHAFYLEGDDDEPFLHMKCIYDYSTKEPLEMKVR